MEHPTDPTPGPGKPAATEDDTTPLTPVPRDETAEMLALDAAGDDPVAEVADPAFPVARRGYDRDAVAAYVQRVAQIVAELHAQRSPRAAVKRALDRVGEETASILQRAHNTADEIAGRSRARADERLQLAEREAQEIIKAAEQRVRELDKSTEELWRERRRLLDDVRAIGDRLREVAEEAALTFPAEGEPPLAAPKAPGPGRPPAPKTQPPADETDGTPQDKPPARSPTHPPPSVA